MLTMTFDYLKLGYPLNFLYTMGISEPNDDQIKGLSYVVSNLDDKTRELIMLRYKECYSLRDLAQHYGFSYQSFGVKLNNLSKKLSTNSYILYGYDGYRNRKSFGDKVEKKRQFDNIYSRVMAGVEKDKDNIILIQKYLFDKKNIPVEYKELKITYSWRSFHPSYFPVLLKTYNCITRARLCNCGKPTLEFGFYDNNVYDLLCNIFDDYTCLMSVRNMGCVCMSDLLSVLYNKGYLLEEQLRFLYNYLPVYWQKSFDELKDFYFTYSGSIHRIG